MNRRERRRLLKVPPARAPVDPRSLQEAAASIARIAANDPAILEAVARQDSEAAAMLETIRGAPGRNPAEVLREIDPDRILAALAATGTVDKAAIDRILAEAGRPVGSG